MTGAFTIQLDYDDYFNYFNAFKITFSTEGGEVEYTFDGIDVNEDTQTLYYKDGETTLFNLLNGETLNYTLKYQTIYSDEWATALSGTVLFSDNATSQITDIEYGNFYYDGGSYYLPFRFTKGEKFESEDLSLRIKYGEEDSVYIVQMTYSGSAYNDEVWQYGYFSFGDISLLTSDPVTLEVYYEDSGEHIIYSEEVNLAVDVSDGDFVPLGLRINNLYDGEQIQIDYILYNGGFVYFDGEQYIDANVYLKFVDQESNEYRTAEFTIGDVYFGGGYLAFPEDMDADEAIRSGRAFNVYLVYTDNMGIEHAVLVYSSFSFTYE